MAGAILMSTPIMAINCIITICIISVFMPVSPYMFGLEPGAFSLSINFFDILALPAMVIVHELMHLVLIPDFLRSDKTFAGITYAGGYAYTEEVITRPRYLAISIAPFIAVSIILPIALGIAGMLTPAWIFLILLNSLGSSVDILSMALVILQSPPGSSLICNGMNTYWKKCN